MLEGCLLVEIIILSWRVCAVIFGGIHL